MRKQSDGKGTRTKTNKMLRIGPAVIKNVVSRKAHLPVALSRDEDKEFSQLPPAGVHLELDEVSNNSDTEDAEFERY